MTATTTPIAPTPAAPARRNWPEYACEAAGLGLFMVIAVCVSTAIAHPASPLNQALPDPFAGRLLAGLAMGLTAVALIYSPIGRRSGAHLNPAVTLTFLRLGKIHPRDALWYVASQVAGGIAGVLLAGWLLGPAATEPPILLAATVPGPLGPGPAALGELLIAGVHMGVILRVINHPRLMRYAGVIAGALVATYITLESPLSGMSLNPARSLASAVGSGTWTAIWIYLLVPGAGMLLAAEQYRRGHPPGAVRCAKLCHDHRFRCIFRCGYCTHDTAPATGRAPAPVHAAA